MTAQMGKHWANSAHRAYYNSSFVDSFTTALGSGPAGYRTQQLRTYIVLNRLGSNV